MPSLTQLDSAALMDLLLHWHRPGENYQTEAERVFPVLPLARRQQVPLPRFCKQSEDAYTIEKWGTVHVSPAWQHTDVTIALQSMPLVSKDA